MRLSEFSVKNSLVVNSLSVMLVLAGLYSLTQIEREAFPNFSFDVVTVRTDYPGASPDVIERRITIPIEKELKEVDDIDEMGSISVEGMSLLIIQLDPDAPDKTRVVNDIQRAVEEARDLPEDLDEDPKVREIQTRNTPLVEVSLSGDLSETELRRLAIDLETEILDMKGVAAVVRSGVRDREIWVEVNPDKMAEYEISLADILTVLDRRNINVPGGLLKGDVKELILRTSGELETSKDVEEVIIRSNDEGNWVQVSDVATVRDSFEELRVRLRTDGSPAMNLMVVKKDKADAIRLMDDLTELVEQFKAKNPQELNIAFVNDISYYIKRRLNVLVSNGYIGLILVMIPIIIFLSTGVAIGAAIGMPIALLTAIAAMHFLGISINLISMFGLIMVLGMLVDEDLVVAENIARYLEEGLSHSEAAIRGAAEVSRAIIAVVLTTIIAFMPLLFMTGIFGKFISDIPKVVMITLAASLLEALIILPSHISDLNKPRREGAKSHYRKKKSHHFFDRQRARYVRSIRYCLKHAYWTSGIAISITIIAILYALFGMRFILFPSKGIEAFFIRTDTAIGTQLEETEKLIQPLEALISEISESELEHYVTQVGLKQNDPNDPFTTRGSHVAQIEVYLTPESKRRRSTDEIMMGLRDRIGDVPGLESISIDPVKPGPPVGRPVGIRIRGEDYAIMEKIAEPLKAELATMPGVHDVRDDYEPGKGELWVTIDEKSAVRAGLDFNTIALTVRAAFEGLAATIIRKADEEIDVVVRLPESLRHERDAVNSLLIPNKRNLLVPLHKVATLQERPGVSVIKHHDGKRTITVTANIDEEVSTSVAVNRHMEEKFKELESAYPGYTITYGGEAEDTQESLQSLFRAFMGAAILIFLILLITFRSLSQTLIVMLAIPFGTVGVVLGFAILGEPLTFLVLLGMVGLTGIVVDSGILLFLFVNRERETGVHIKDAIANACGKRLRPIFLTTLTTFLGVVPAAYGIGGSDPFIRPMALALNWGLAVSMFFTLYAMPCIYYLTEHWYIRLKHLIHLKVRTEE